MLRGENAADVLAPMGLPSVTQEYSAKGKGERAGDTAATPANDGTQGATAPAAPEGEHAERQGPGRRHDRRPADGHDAAAEEGAQNGLLDYLLGGDGK